MPTVTVKELYDARYCQLIKDKNQRLQLAESLGRFPRETFSGVSTHL